MPSDSPSRSSSSILPFSKSYQRPTHVKGRMNKLEEDYSWQLQLQLMSGKILWWKFEPIKLRLADATFYDVDFLVMREDATLEIHEVKGHWEDDAVVKFKVAREAFPIFKFLAVTRKGKTGAWEITERVVGS